MKYVSSVSGCDRQVSPLISFRGENLSALKDVKLASPCQIMGKREYNKDITDLEAINDHVKHTKDEKCDYYILYQVPV